MFEYLFSYPLTHYQEASLAFDMPVPLWMAVCIGALIVVFLSVSMFKAFHALSWWRIGLLGLLQLSVFSILFFMFSQPVLVIDRLLNTENDIVFVLDGSQSMAYGESGSPRIDQALEIFQSSPLKQINQNYQVQHYIYSDKEQSVEDFNDIPAPKPVSNLGSSLLNILQQASTQSIGAIILATDGVDTQSSTGSLSADQLAGIASYNVPIHTIGFGRTVIPEDLEITNIQMPSTVLPNTLIKANISIRHDAAGVARIKVYDGDRFISSQEVTLQVSQQSTNATAGVNSITNTSIEFDAGSRGFKDIRIVLDPLEGELNLQNNSFSKLLEVRDGRYQILYVDGEPRWEYKFIRRALESDSTLSLHTLLWVSDNKFYRQGIASPDQLAEGFPIEKGELFSYDAIIIGSVAAPRFNEVQQKLIFDFVNERGGSLIMLGGRHGLAEGSWGNSQVGQLLPARLKDLKNSFVRELVQAQLTSSGISSTMLKFTEKEDDNLKLWQSLPALSDYQLLGNLRPAASVLLSMGNDAPLLVTQPYGKGKASIFATAASWRWQMKLPADDDRHQRFWQQLIRSHVVDTQNRFDFKANIQSNKVELNSQISNEYFEPLDGVDISILLSNEDDSESQKIEMKSIAGELGSYRAELPLSSTGVFYAEAIASLNGELLGNARIAFDMPDNDFEYFNIRQNRAQLERLSNVTGGRYWQADDLDDLPFAISRSKAGITEQQRDPLWSIPLLFILLLTIKVIEWLLRRRWGKI